MVLSALIPFKPDHGPRDKIWSIVRKRYQKFFPEIEVCLGLDESEPFCRSRAINQAAGIATGDVFIISDTDVVFNPCLIEGIRRTIPKRAWFIPFKNAFRLNRQASERLLLQGIPSQITIRKEDILFNEQKAGTHMNVMTRHAFETVGGLDERFLGWGYEDTALVAALDTFCGKYVRLDGDVFHLWHPPAPIISDRLQANRSLWRRYESAYGRVIEMRLLINERMVNQNAKKRGS